jgi:Heavy metal binding domain
VKSESRIGFIACAAWLMTACAQSGEHAGVRAPASSEAEEAPARPIATSLASDPLQEQAPEQPAREGHQHHHHGAGAAPESAQYTCPMHPEVQQAGPGECPKCGMRLVQKPSPQAEPAHEHAN